MCSLLWGGHEISAFDHLRVVGRGVFCLRGKMRLGKREQREVKRDTERERMEGRSLLQFGVDRGKMTTHRAAFSFVDSVCRTSLRPPWPPWPLVEFAAVRSDILGFGTGSGLCCQGEGFCSYVGKCFWGWYGLSLLEADQEGFLVSDLCLPIEYHNLLTVSNGTTGHFGG